MSMRFSAASCGTSFPSSPAASSRRRSAAPQRADIGRAHGARSGARPLAPPSAGFRPPRAGSPPSSRTSPPRAAPSSVARAARSAIARSSRRARSWSGRPIRRARLTTSPSGATSPASGARKSGVGWLEAIHPDDRRSVGIRWARRDRLGQDLRGRLPPAPYAADDTAGSTRAPCRFAPATGSSSGSACSTTPTTRTSRPSVAPRSRTRSACSAPRSTTSGPSPPSRDSLVPALADYCSVDLVDAEGRCAASSDDARRSREGRAACASSGRSIRTGATDRAACRRSCAPASPQVIPRSTRRARRSSRTTPEHAALLDVLGRTFVRLRADVRARAGASARCHSSTPIRGATYVRGGRRRGAGHRRARRHRDRQRAPLRRRTDGEPRQERVPRDDEPRAAHAAQRHRRLRRADGDGLRGPVPTSSCATSSRIQRSQQHLLEIINDMLNFSRIEAGHVQYDDRARAGAARCSSGWRR